MSFAKELVKIAKEVEDTNEKIANEIVKLEK